MYTGDSNRDPANQGVPLYVQAGSLNICVSQYLAEGRHPLQAGILFYNGVVLLADIFLKHIIWVTAQLWKPKYKLGLRF